VNKKCRSCLQSLPEGVSICPICGVSQEGIYTNLLISVVLLAAGIFIRPHIASNFWHIVVTVLRWYIVILGGTYFVVLIYDLIKRFTNPIPHTRIICSLLGHKIGHWKFVSSHSCKQIRSCERGDYEEERTVPHQYNDWKYMTDNTCQQTRTCERDGFQESRVQHQFGKWKYIADNTCQQTRICERDGFQEWQAQHRFGEWKYQTDNSCEQIRICKLDGFQEVQISHQWGDWEEEEYTDAERAQDLADWTLPDYGPRHAPQYSYVRQCKKCGQTGTRYDKP
jgi:hypothetical protein